MAKRYLDQKLKFRQLRAIAAIDARKSLLQASGVLGVSQPALTKTLKDIEDLFGFRLFERHARGLAANRRGLLVAETARRILGDLRTLEDALDRMDEDPAGTVVIGALPTAASGLMPGIIARARADGRNAIARPRCAARFPAADPAIGPRRQKPNSATMGKISRIRRRAPQRTGPLRW